MEIVMARRIEMEIGFRSILMVMKVNGNGN
jgi:hypothetical protein